MNHDANDARHEMSGAPPLLAPQIPLPPYAYRPGRNAHPLRHPQGHMFGGVEMRPPLPAQNAWATETGHLHAIDLFNNKFWWEAHEAWESYWHSAPVGTAEHHALKGLIQFAALHLKIESADVATAATLQRNALQNLEVANGHGLVRGGRCLGFDLIEICALITAAAPHLPAPKAQ